MYRCTYGRRLTPLTGAASTRPWQVPNRLPATAAAALLALVVGCGTVVETAPATAPTTTPATTSQAPATTSEPRSVWCNNRDAGLWPRYDPEPYDPSFLDAEKAAIQRRLDATLADSLETADRIYAHDAETYADDPDTLTELEDSHRRLRSQMRADHRSVVADLERRFAQEHRQARAVHDAAERDRAELAALQLSNEMKRYELECR